MSGALSWTNHNRAELDGIPALSGNLGTSALAFDAAYPGTNMLTPDPSQVSRINFTRNATNNTDITVNCTFSASNDKPIRVIGLINCRFPSNTTFVQCVARNTGGGALESTSAITFAQMVLQPRTTDRYDLFWILAAERLGCRVDYNVRIPASNSGYFEIGHPWAGPALVWPNGVGADWQMTGADSSIVSDGPGGGYSAYAYPVRKVLHLTKRGLQYVDALGDPAVPAALSLRQAIFEAGTSEPVIAISDDETPHSAQVQSTYGRFREVPNLAHLSAGRYGTGLVVQQIR